MPPCSILANRKQLATGSFISRAPSSHYSSYGGCCAFSFSDRRVPVAIGNALFPISRIPAFMARRRLPESMPKRSFGWRSVTRFCPARVQSEPSNGLHPSHAIESPDAQSGKTQSRKSESFALDALSPPWTRDRAVGTAPRRLRASQVRQCKQAFTPGKCSCGAISTL